MNGGNIYLTGDGSKNYLDVIAFKKNNIDVAWQDFQISLYRKINFNYKKNLSVLDFLMMNDFDIDSLMKDKKKLYKF